MIAQGNIEKQLKKLQEVLDKDLEATIKWSKKDKRIIWVKIK